MKIGIFGGTFNPPHIGHLNIAQNAAEICGLDKIIFIPSKIPPHKDLPETTASPEQRLEMTNLLADSVKSVPTEVSRCELDREGKSYTVDTLKILKKMYPNDELFFILGGDMLLSFDTCWKSPEQISSLCKILAFSRNNVQKLQLIQCADMLKNKYNSDIAVIDCDIIDISSTSIRNAMRIGKCSRYLTDKVFDFIKSNKLYNFNSRLYSLRSAAKNRLSRSRYLHVLGCERQAAALAKKWNVDEYSAREAAILHDITKEVDIPSQLQLCSQYGIIPEYIHKIPIPILHGISGAYVAKTEFHCSPEIENAIKYHSTGRVNMSNLEKIIFISDMTEPGRDYDGVQNIRSKSFKNLDAAVAVAMKAKINHICKTGGKPTKDLKDAFNQYNPKTLAI